MFSICITRRYGKSTAIPAGLLHFDKNKGADFLLEDNFFPARAILMFSDALERGDQGLSITSKIFEISSLSFENASFKIGGVRTARTIFDVYYGFSKDSLTTSTSIL